MQSLLLSCLYFVLLAITVFLSGCYYDTEEELYGVGVCDTSVTTYSGYIKPMLDANCISCHSGGSPSGQIDLASYPTVKIQVDNGKLYGSVAQLAGFKAMPQGGKLSNCDITKLKIWIDAGAQQN